jgi:hypothetical protein
MLIKNKHIISIRTVPVNKWILRPHSFPPDWIPTGIDKYNNKMMIATIRNPDLFQDKS